MVEHARPSVRVIFDAHARYVWRALRHLGVHEPEIPDVCQEVFIVVHRRLPEFEGRSSLRTWLYGICLRAASDHRRRAYVRNERPTSDSELPVQAAHSERPDTRLEDRRTLQALLDLLDQDKREIVVLYELEGFTMKEVAEIVGCPLQTAYSRLHAARECLLAAKTEDAP